MNFMCFSCGFSKKCVTLNSFASLCNRRISAHHSLKLLDLPGAFAFRHTAPVSFMRMRLVVFLLIHRRPVVKLGDGVFQNLGDRAVKIPGNSHRQSEYETAQDQFFRCVLEWPLKAYAQLYRNYRAGLCRKRRIPCQTHCFLFAIPYKVSQHV